MMISEFCMVNMLHETQLARLYLTDKAQFELLTKKKSKFQLNREEENIAVPSES